ncbi:hypothetical protein D0817_19280 [Flavobacterium cupreum]|uniref:Uncharacterized protein n=2 Tax=Flavobacterium TaxID=237 RepID=A0A4Y7UA30_9FLAO|nr:MULTISPECIES: hypothetical protein [Flavobacterium]RUT68760.1 hypothetical protein D0817_19280 [Flavobacterium cupreum]TCN55501.1 hypothetical protein EV142_106190 [Flavobacterium circumlabens]TEB43091.1 hypothetical protein D0809_16790 [Flavobacterium circumlabens]
MTEIQKLFSKKDALLVQLACIQNDINDYITHPVETVSIQQIHYQYEFIIKEIRRIDTKIYDLFNKQSLSLALKNRDLKKLTDIATSTFLFTVKDLPKLHFLMFNNSDL